VRGDYPTLPRLHYVGGATLCGYVSAGAVAHRSKVKILGSAPGGEKSGETGALRVGDCRMVVRGGCDSVSEEKFAVQRTYFVKTVVPIT